MNDASSPEAGNPGATLREARLRRGLSPEQVTAETNISPRYVQALEEDDYSALPGQAFARGYLRRYAQLVQVDADALVPAFDRLWLQQHPAPVVGLAAAGGARKSATTAARTGSLMDQGLEQVAGSVRQFSLSRLLSLGSLALLALLLIGTLFWQGDDEPEVPRIDESMPLDIDAEMAGSAPSQPQPELPPLVEPQSVAPVEAPAPADAAAVAAVDAGTAPVAGAAPGAVSTPAVAPVASAAPVAASAVKSPVVPAPAANVIPVHPQAATTTPVAAAPVATAPVVKPAAVMPATAPAAVQPVKPANTLPLTAPTATPTVDTLNFNFAGKSWISVRDATGQELVYGLKGEGQTVSVTGQAPFSINIGNVKVTTMTRNGKPVSLKPYTRGEIASFRLNK